MHSSASPGLPSCELLQFNVALLFEPLQPTQIWPAFLPLCPSEWRHSLLMFYRAARGKLTVLLQYLGSLVTPTTEMLKTIKKLLNNFLWGSNVNKIKHTTMMAEYDKGGLKMPDVESILYAQRLMWARRYFSTEHRPWKVFFEWQFFLICASYSQVPT